MKIKYKPVECNGALAVQFWIGNQGFTLNYLAEDEDDAEWMIENLSDAHKKLKEGLKVEILSEIKEACYAKYHQSSKGSDAVFVKGMGEILKVIGDELSKIKQS